MIPHSFFSTPSGKVTRFGAALGFCLAILGLLLHVAYFYFPVFWLTLLAPITRETHEPPVFIRILYVIGNTILFGYLFFLLEKGKWWSVLGVLFLGIFMSLITIVVVIDKTF